MNVQLLYTEVRSTQITFVKQSIKNGQKINVNIFPWFKKRYFVGKKEIKNLMFNGVFALLLELIHIGNKTLLLCP